jgi:hypothetical protein
VKLSHKLALGAAKVAMTLIMMTSPAFADWTNDPCTGAKDAEGRLLGLQVLFATAVLANGSRPPPDIEAAMTTMERGMQRLRGYVATGNDDAGCQLVREIAQAIGPAANHLDAISASRR